MNEEQIDELDALEAIFGSDFGRGLDAGGCVRVRPTDTSLSVDALLTFKFGPDYPHRPDMSLSERSCELVLGTLQQAALDIATEQGTPSVMRLIDLMQSELRIADVCSSSNVAHKDKDELLQIAVANVSLHTHATACNDAFAGSFFQLCSEHVIRIILGYVDGVSLARCCQVCRAFRRIAMDRDMWRECLRREFSHECVAASTDPRDRYIPLHLGRKRREQTVPQYPVRRYNGADRPWATKSVVATTNPMAYRSGKSANAVPVSASPPFAKRAAKTGDGDSDSDDDTGASPKRFMKHKKKPTLSGRKYYS
eukprot:m51a1_g3890 hypothetical protein (310) ;mRNA; f:63203-64344